ncbi:MAG: hypothetical protein EXX96DRAFT_337369 [Benjaminiella poitrasii]|nr:MAG: hypothetical protein EXX96DRAFT_337369 [Benjaminiella poitrasii]
MYVLPGVKTIRINGYLKTQAPAGTFAPTGTSTPIYSTTDKKKLSKHGLKHQMMIQQAEADALERAFKEACAERKDFLLEYSVRSLKKEWIRKDNSQLTEEERTHNASIYEKVQAIKEKRDKINEKMKDLKQKLANTRRGLYHKQKQITSEDYSAKKNTDMITNKLLSITNQSYKGIGKVENVSIDKSLVDSDKLVFSGTDNGLVTMTETVEFLIERFKFHLDMYNRYSILQDNLSLDKIGVHHSPFLSLPKPFKVYARDIDYGSGAWKARKRLES